MGRLRLKKVILFSLVLGLGACATKTAYQPHGREGGYSEIQVGENLYMSRFSGNALTHANDASLYSAFRAIEICHQQGKAVARVHGVVDESTQKSVVKSSNYQYQAPTYFSGTSSSSTNYDLFGGAFGSSSTETDMFGSTYGGQTYGGGQTWTETYNFPTYDTYFSCVDETFFTGINLQQISKEDMRAHVKDLLGALQVVGTTSDSPNIGRIEKGDFIIRVAGIRVENVIDYWRAVDGADNKQRIQVEIVRDGVRKSIFLEALDATREFINIQDQVVNMVCSGREVVKRPVCSGQPVTASAESDNDDSN